MGTKIHTTSFLREFHSVIELDANATRSSYGENGILRNGKNPDSISCYDIEKVRQTILEHESIFKNQLHELHRLYGRQQELMNEIKRRGIVRDDVMEEKFRLSYLLSPVFTENAKRSWNSSSNSIFSGGTYNLGFSANLYSKFPVVEITSEKRNHQTSQHVTDALTFSLCHRNSYRGDTSIANPTKAEVSANLWSSLDLVTKDFFHGSLDRMNKEGALSIQGSRNERNGKEHLFDDHGVNFPDKRRIDRHSSLEDSKSVAFPQSLLAEPRKEFLNSPLDIGTSLSRKKKKKIFGVEISEGNTDAFDSTSNMSSNLDPHERNHRVDLSSSYVQSLSLHEGNERSKTDWGMNGEWLDFTKVDKANMAAAEVLKKDREHSQKSRERILRGNQENSKGTLPWFLRDSQGSSDLNKTKCSYFMNLDSLQSCSHKFFKKVELQNSNQKKEVKGEISEVNSSGLGDDFARKVEIDENAPKNHLEIEEVVSSKGLNNFISDLRHCIDLNLSLDEEEAPPLPSLPSAIMKIATAEIDLEAPAVIECELDASPKGLGSKESSSLEEQDNFAAEVMIGISSHAEKKRDDDDDDDDNSFTRLKWFAQVISSEKFDESIPSDMDDFEFMTLKLKETKEEHPPYEPSLKDPSDDEALTRRTRRGQLRRGRQRRDFQQDILSGLVTLSRLQVTEDFQAFEELLKAKDRTRESGLGPWGPTRNGRGRKHLGAPITVKAPCSSHAEIEERSLAGWGKKTRRLPRQRCPNALLSFPVKC